MARQQQRQWGSNLPPLLRPVRGRRRIGRYVTSRINREFRPVAREMQRQQRQLRGTQRQINRSYRGANQATRQLASTVQDSHLTSAQTLGGVLGSLASGSQAFADRLAAQQSSEAQARGGLDPAAQTRDLAGQSTAVNSDIGAARIGALLAQGNAASTGLLGTIAANNARRQQDIGKVRAQRGDLRRDRIDLAKRRGEFRSEILNDLQERERDFYIKHKAFAGDAADRAQGYDYNDAMREQARLGLAGDKARARAHLGAAKQYGKNSRQKEEQQGWHQSTRRGVRLLEGFQAKEPRKVAQLLRDRREIINTLINSHGVGERQAIRAFDRFIKTRRQKEAADKAFETVREAYR